MSATYSIELDESENDLGILNGAGYNFALARAVSTNGAPAVSNTIFKTNTDMTNPNIGPYNSLSWTENYGLNYTLIMPGPGEMVPVSGQWQPVNIGEYWSINKSGIFEPTTGPGSKTLNVVNDYQDAGIVIGIKGNNGTYNPIFVSSYPLPVNSEAAYEPLEEISLWWGGAQFTGDIISTQETPVESYTLTAGTKVYFYYNAIDKQWKFQLTPFHFE